MKTYKTTLPVQFKFFGRAKPLDKQSFDAKLEELRTQAYAAIPIENNFPWIRYKIDCAIDAIKTLLKDIWTTPEKLAQVASSIRAYIRVDNNYKAYAVAICYEDAADQTRCESTESSTFDEAEKAEKNEMLEKYFHKMPPKHYRVTYENYEAVLTEQQLSDLRKDYSDFYFEVKAI